MPRTQAHRLIAINTPLGADTLLLRSFTLHEEISRLFQLEADLISADPNINFDDIIGQNATIRLDLGNGKTRYFNGVVSRFVQSGQDKNYALYKATLVPWLWFLTRAADCRIFQEKKVPEIIEAVFKAQNFADYELNLSGTYRKWEYCVQYRETDFNFVSRLMEQEGIYYFFKHENGKHTVVLADANSAHQAYPGYETVVYRPPSKALVGRECISEWVMEKEVQPGAYELNDFDFKSPKKVLRAKSGISRNHERADLEVYDYPGEYLEHAEGESYAKVRIEELQGRYELLRGQATARGLAAGSLFTLKDHPREDQNREHLITSASYRIEAGEFESSGAKEAGEFFSCSFTAISSTAPFTTFRPARLTPKPAIQGPQTAMVVGPKGEEIHTDKYGRVKLQFPWDRYGKADENASCWVRVSQSWAGKKWGAIYLPRIGQEVVVEFLEGDPDHPIITGRVYNGEAMPPYDLPGKATLSTLKSNSSKGGQGFNEIRFEDKKGEEQIFMHGEKNLDIRIKNDSFEWIGNDLHLVVKKDQIEHVENNRSEVVDADHMEKIGKDRHLKVLGKEAKEVGKSLSLTVKGDVIEVFKKNHSEETTNDYYLKADNIVIEGLTNVTIKVGGSSIAIAEDGIALKTDGLVKIEAGSTMDLKADKALTIKSSKTAEVKSPATTVKGDDKVTIKGGEVLIN